VSTERDVTRIVRSWLDEGVTQLPDRVLDAVLDQLPATPQRRADWLARRFPRMNTFVRIAAAAAAVILVAIVGIKLLPLGGVGGPGVSPTPTASETALVGRWVTPDVTCEQQKATVLAAGYTAEQMALSEWTCPGGTTNHYTIIFGGPAADPNVPKTLVLYERSAVGWSGVYRVVDASTFEAGDSGTYYITYHFAISGNRLTIDMVRDDCPSCTPGASLLGELMAQTAIYETSAFTRQP
jgi:hypothetical protein